MDAQSFDGLARSLAEGASRRSILKGLVATALGLTVASRATSVLAQANACEIDADCDDGYCCPEGTFHDGTCKSPNGGACNGNGNCCSNFCDKDAGVCADIPGCSSDTDCDEVDACTPADCVSESCNTVSTCVEGTLCCEDASCNECCADTDCVAEDCGVCNTDGVCVYECPDDTCESDEDCVAEDCGVCNTEGICEYECPDESCASDEDCVEGACCCEDGSCSADCCATQLPETGAGSESDQTSWIAGAALLGGAAAVIGAKVLRKPDAESSQ